MAQPGRITEFQRVMWQSAGLYALFLIPTGLLLAHAGLSDTLLSTNIGGTWQARFWQFPGLSEVGSRVVLDVMESLLIAGITWLFYQGYRQLSAIQALTEMEQWAFLHRLLRWIALIGLLLVAVVPFHSSDLYGYLNRGFQQTISHTNPYLTTISDIPGWQRQPLFHPHWIYNPCPYGFFFAQLAAWLANLGGNTFTGAFLLFKSLNVLCVLGTTALIQSIGQRLNLKRPWLAAYLFGANPLVLLHAVGNGHNDILLAFLLMASLWVLLSTRWRWACLPLLALSILTKYASVLALPFVLVYLAKQRHYRALAVGMLLSLALTLWLALPYVDLHQPWPWSAMLDNAGKPQHSLIDMLASAVYYPTKRIFGHADAAMNLTLKLLKPIFLLGFVALYVRQWLQFTREDASTGKLMFHIGLSMTVLVALISAKFHPWYPLMFLPLVLVLPESSRLRQFGLMLSVFQIAGFTIFQNLPVFSELVLTVLPLWLVLSGRYIFKPAAEEST